MGIGNCQNGFLLFPFLYIKNWNWPGVF